MNSRFPKGDKDINAAANELLNILNNRISQDEAQEIVRLSTGISRISRDFTKDVVIYWINKHNKQIKSENKHAYFQANC